MNGRIILLIMFTVAGGDTWRSNWFWLQGRIPSDKMKKIIAVLFAVIEISIF